MFRDAKPGNAPGTFGDNAGAVIAGYAHALLEHLEKSGHDPVRILGDEVRHLLQTPASQRLDGQLSSRLLAHVCTVLNDPVYPLRLAAHVQPRHLGLVGYLVMACPTLADAALVLHRYEPLLDQVSLTALSMQEGQVHMTWLPVMAAPTPAHIMFALGLWVHQARALTGRQDLACDADFCFAPPPHPQDLQLFQSTFGGTVRFNQASNQLIAPASHAVLPLQDASAEVHARLLAVAEERLAQMACAPDTWLGMVEHTIRRALENSRPSLTQVAASLGVAPRTLQHRLDQEGLRFRQLVDRLQQERALRLLGQAQLSVADVALKLGFANQSAFNHAFKRWTGEAPGVWRNAQRTERP